MKYTHVIFTVLCLVVNSLHAQVPINCQDLIRAKDQAIAELNKDKGSLTRQVNELQTRIITGTNVTTPCGPSYEKDYNKAKEEIIALSKQVKEVEREHDTKDALLKIANKDITQLKEDTKNLAKTNESQALELQKREKELEDLKKKYADLDKAFQDSEKAALVLKTTAQILYDSLYMSVDFINKGIVHIDSKPDGKQVKLDDILFEVPYAAINSRDWPNDVQVKLTQIGALYVKYKDKLTIQLTGAPIETEEDKKIISTIFGKLMSRFSIYANAGRPNGDKISLERDKDFQIDISEKGKQGFIRIALIRRK